MTERELADIEAQLHEPASIRRHKVRALLDEVRRLRTALEEIAEPTEAQRKRARAAGYLLDGQAAMALARDGSYLSGLAAEALK